MAQICCSRRRSVASSVIHHIAIHSHDILPKANTLFVALRGKHADGHAFVAEAAQRGAAFALVNQTFTAALPNSITLLRVDDPLHALQELAALYRQQAEDNCDRHHGVLWQNDDKRSSRSPAALF